MKFDAPIEAFIKEFVKDIAANNVAIFAGAGMSKSSGYVDWAGLLSDIAEELGLKISKEHDLISLAQYHVNHRGNRAGLKRKILEEFSHQAEPSPAHAVLARLPIPTYWTTNYDTLIEDTLRSNFKVADVKHQVKQLANTRPKRDAVVYKMHGDVHSPDDAILTKAQYETYYKTHEAFITALSGDLISKTFLFIGFSFTDPNLDYVLSRLSDQPLERQHYCFVKRENRRSDEDEELYTYRLRKQDLRIADLKRYRIKALLVDEYEVIPKILEEIESRYRKKTVFISGSAEEYGSWDRATAQQFIHSLAKKLVNSGYRVVNGFGWGIGSAVINGALEAVYENPERNSEDQLVMRPFPQFETSGKALKELWEEYRQRMIGLAGIAIFVFGNKRDDNGGVVNASGVGREFEIALSNGLVPLPIGATGYMAAEIASKIDKSQLLNADWLCELVKVELCDDAKMPDKLLDHVMAAVDRLNK